MTDETYQPETSMYIETISDDQLERMIHRRFNIMRSHALKGDIESTLSVMHHLGRALEERKRRDG